MRDTIFRTKVNVTQILAIIFRSACLHSFLIITNGWNGVSMLQYLSHTTQTMKFFVKYFFSKCEQIFCGFAYNY